MAKKKRIDVSKNASESLANPFDILSSDGLPQRELPKSPQTEKPEPENPVLEKLGRVLLRRETAHRGGKTVIIIHDFPNSVSSDMISAWGKELRKKCGTGGTVKNREIEIQGEAIPMIRAYFEKLGFRVGGER